MPTEDQLGMWEVEGATLQTCSRTETDLERAALILDWRGLVVEDMVLFGQRVAVVAEVDQDVHRARLASGWEPVTDRMTLALWDEWSGQFTDVPPNAITLTGFLARGKRWQRVLAAAGGFVGFGATAIVLEQDRMPNRHCLITADLRGVAVLNRCSNGEIELVRPGRCGPVPTARPSVVSRWVEELVYQRILEDELLSATDAP